MTSSMDEPPRVPPPVVTRPVTPAPAPRSAELTPPFVTGRMGPVLAGAPMAAEVPVPPEPASDSAARDELEPGWPALEEEGSAEAAWDTHEPLPEDTADEFPLDAFIIPEDSRVLPTGMVEDVELVLTRLSDRLEELARRVRTDGFAALADLNDADELTRHIGATISRYYGRSA